eukprot:6437656-Amphidinium_carterae.2
MSPRSKEEAQSLPGPLLPTSNTGREDGLEGACGRADQHAQVRDGCPLQGAWGFEAGIGRHDL